MLKDIDSGLINTIIVKDLSRFGRNYIKVGYYLHYYFPGRNIRFISKLKERKIVIITVEIV